MTEAPQEGAADLLASSLRRHKQVFKNQLKPHFKKTSLKAIGPREVLKYIRFRQQKGAAPNTLYKELAGLSAVMNFCVSEEIIPANPVKAVKKPKLRLIRPNYSPTEDQLTKILNQLYPGARRFFLALVNSGCRLGEIQRANVGDVDWDAGTLRVIRKGGNVDFVPLESSVLRAVIKEELESRANPGPNDPLFVNQHGKRYLRITRSLTTACRIAKVPHCTHHSLRHAYANLLRKRRHDIVTISKLLGHANPAITLKVYSHWHDEEVRKAAATVAIGPELDQGAKLVQFKRRKRL